MSRGEELSLDVLVTKLETKLLVSHPETGLVCEHWCYETGPFGKYRGDVPLEQSGVRNADGSVVMVHTRPWRERTVKSTTTFRTGREGRVVMDVDVEGAQPPVPVYYVGPCTQCWHSEAFMRRGGLIEFAGRCFFYTMRGPVSMMDTARVKMKDVAADAPDNNPPCTQWYMPLDRPHLGNIWGFGTSGDRVTHNLMGVTSADGKWLCAIGCKHNIKIAQGWHDCIHHLPDMTQYLDVTTGRFSHRSMIYVMRNDPKRLLELFREDFPWERDEAGPRIKAGKGGTLEVKSVATEAPGLELRLETVEAGAAAAKSEGSGSWEETYWGTLIRKGKGQRTWVHPVGGRVRQRVVFEGSTHPDKDKPRPAGESVEVCVSLDGKKWKSETARVKAQVSGKEWRVERAPEGVPAQVLKSADGKWLAAIYWERSDAGNPALGVPVRPEEGKETISVRGRVLVTKSDPDELVRHWQWAAQDWKNAGLFHMPVEDAR